ncbi:MULTISPECIES: presqualene diphosphate synthase HpnD [Methylosinus]|uniref:Squalene synthase HpnD n=1 Tax=Methylosinus trichosporium (strain ATCC 35070 / NCIMB 11131 / UNIQEM 75 / OB3b) TaxID=595536 RepID=A0A2D2D0H9_METT3|nr:MULTISPECIES: presqualene diphosphate synthase HpnD [Methylosinus]ATQ68472.1 squalene synthase HpnD [Methylosinus trichosporium OB3b]OBS53993.1 squalene synthase HpnD [Methylosinus sp. 3S-1]
MSVDSLTLLTDGAAKPVAAKSSFYLAMRVLEPERRDAMYAIYGFCRAVDDIADEAGDRDARLSALDDWRRDLDELYAGRTHKRCADLAAPVRRFALDRADFEAVIDGMAMDVVEDIRAPDWERLDLYCDRVASAVGRLSVRVFGLADEADCGGGALPTKARLLAFHMGRALQLTNILRDLDEDDRRGRLYLPREALEAAGVPDLSPGAALAHPGVADACAAVAERARKHYGEAELIMRVSPQRAVKAPYLMATAYRSILDRLVARGFAPPRAPVSASRAKVLLALVKYALT